MVEVIAFVHTPTLPCLVNFSLVAAPGERVKYTVGVTFFFFYSPTCAQPKRGGLDECKMAHNTRIRVNIPLLGVKILRPNFLGVFYPKDPHNLGSE